MARPAKPGIVRFWAKVEKHDGCWRWTGTTAQNGYGRLFRSWDRKGTVYTMAHRFSWELHYGPIPPGLQVCHRCDNKLCVNPAHLFLGSHQDNMADRDAKDRQAKGEGHGMAKLDELKIQWIRAQHRNGWGQRRIAMALGVNKSTVARVLHGKIWQHVKQA